MRAMLLVMAAAVGMMGQAATGPLVLAVALPEEARIEQVVGRDVVAKWTEVRIDARVVEMDPTVMKNAVWEVRTWDE